MKNFILFFFINLLVHLPFMNLPPCGTHVWRQCNTLAMSRNFAEEGMNIFEPKIDRRNETNGITGSHFPLYEWLLAACSKLFGFSDLLARVFSLIIFTFTMFAFYLLLLHFRISDLIAKTGALLLLSIPELYYQSINAMPDNLALCLGLYGLICWLQYINNNQLKYLLWAIIFSTDGGLIKFQFLIIPMAAIVFVPFKFKNYLQFILAFTLITVLVTAWYYHALNLTKLNNLREYGLWVKPIPLSDKLAILKGNLLMDIPEMLLGWPLLLAFIFVIYKNFRLLKFSKTTYFTLAWLAMFVVFYIVAIERMLHHAYYFMPLLPLLIFIFIQIAHKSGLKAKFMIVIVLLNFTWAFVRVIPSRWVENKLQIPIEFSVPELRNELTKTIPPNSKCVVGPDISGCIFFYFTHTKGYSFESADELIKIKENRMDIENMRAAGMQYLIIKDGKLLQPYLNDLHLKGKIKTIGDFEIWKL